MQDSLCKHKRLERLLERGKIVAEVSKDVAVWVTSEFLDAKVMGSNPAWNLM